MKISNHSNQPDFNQSAKLISSPEHFLEAGTKIFSKLDGFNYWYVLFGEKIDRLEKKIPDEWNSRTWDAKEIKSSPEGAEVANFVTSDKFRCLILAAVYHKKKNLLKILLGLHQTNTLSVEAKEVTPLCVACAQGDLETVKLLEQAGFEINEPLKQGSTLLHIASSYGRLEIVKYFLTLPGIDLNQVNDRGCTALHTACDSGNLEVIKTFLLDPRTDFNKINFKGQTPLHLACKQKYLDIAQSLMCCKKIDLNIKNREGKTARDLISQEKTWDEIREIMDCMLEPKTENEKDPIISYLYKKSLENSLVSPTWLAWSDQLRFKGAQGVFSLMVFLSDDYLITTNNQNDEDLAKMVRFFKIAQKLPIEMQMILAHRCFESNKSFVLSKQSEPCFRHLARLALLSSNS